MSTQGWWVAGSSFHFSIGKPHWAPLHLCSLFCTFWRGWIPYLPLPSPKLGSERLGFFLRTLIIQFSAYYIHLGTEIVLLLRESGPVGPELNYCICGAWMALIHVIRLADLIRELLQGKPEKAASTRDIFHPVESCVPGEYIQTHQGLCLGLCWRWAWIHRIHTYRISRW